MAKYLSGKSKKTPQSGLRDDRYRYLDVSQAEPNLGDASLFTQTLPIGIQQQLVSVIGYPGQRYWIPVGGGAPLGGITVYDESIIVPSNAGVGSITQLNFVGASISTKGYFNIDGSPGIGVTITVFSPGTQGQIIFNNNNDFSAASALVYDNITNYVGIGTSIPTQELDLNGDLRLRGTIYDYNNQPGITGDLLVKNNFGGLTWTNERSIRSGAGGTITNIQYHNDIGLVDGASNFVFDYTNNRVGLGSTQPGYLLDVLGYSRFNGQTEIDYLNVTGVATISQLGVTNLITTKNITVTETSTFTGTIDANGGATIDNVRIGIANDNTIDTSTGNLTIDSAGGTTIINDKLSVTGITSVGFITATTGFVGILTVTEINIDRTNLIDLNVTGIASIATLGVTGFTTTKDLIVTGITTLRNTLYITNTTDAAGDIIANGGTDGLFGIFNSTNSGSITFNPKNSGGTYIKILDLNSSIATVNGSFAVSGISTFNGNVTFGDATSDIVSFTSRVGTGITPSSDGVLDLGGLNNKWNNLYVNTVNGNIIGYASSIAVSLDSTNTNRYIPFVDVTAGLSTARTDDLFVWNPSTSSLGIGTTNPVSTLDVNGPIISRQGAFVVSNTNPITDGNVDHIWHIDGPSGGGFGVNYYGLGGGWNFVSDSTYKAIGNSWVVAGGFSVGEPVLRESYRLQVTGNGYISGNLGIGTTSPRASLDVNGNVIPSINATSSTDANGKDLGGTTDYWRKVYAREFVGAINGNADTANKADAATILSPRTSSPYTTIDTQGSYIHWNRQNGDGATWLINQRGSGGGGFVFADSTASASNVNGGTVGLTQTLTLSRDGLLTVQNIKPTGIQDTSGGTGTDNFVLTANGTGGWTWKQASTSGGAAAIGGITIRDQGTLQGTASAVTSINFVGDDVTATASGIGATITFTTTAAAAAGATAGTNAAQPYAQAAASSAQAADSSAGQAATSAGQAATSASAASSAGATAGASAATNVLNNTGSAGQVLYKNASNVATTSPNFTFDGSTTVGIRGGVQLVINNTSPTVYLQDTDHRSCMLHCNSNIFYILRGDGVNSTTWAASNGYWPLQINLEDNDAQFGGNLRAIGDIIAYSASDQRLKDNITPIPNALDKVLSISGNTFDWNEKSDHEGNDVGVIAQEILEVLPEAVTTRDTGYLAVRYEKIIPLLIEAIKEQQETITNLQNRIEILEGK